MKKRFMFFLFLILLIGSVSAYTLIENLGREYVHEFGTEYSTEKFDLPVVDNEVRILINQNGKDFGDVEAVRLNACGEFIKPRYARYVSGEYITDDIIEIDNNVVVFSEKGIEVVWDVFNCNKAEVYLTANEYGRASPFRFEGSYKIGSNPERISVDYSGKGFCSVYSYAPYWKPSTGHPEGYTYVYISDDSDNVYFSLDVTPDNTEEYGEDWVEVKIGKKTFRVDDFSDKYGKCWFGLTEKVNYKHQVCDFVIPRKEIEFDEELDFELRYYGTAGGPTSVTACGSIITSGNYILTQNIESAKACINITAIDVELDCDGYSVIYDTGGTNARYGINTTTVSNITIKNCNIMKSSTGGINGFGVYLYQTRDSLIKDNNITTNGSSRSDGIYSFESYNVTISGNNISTNGSSSSTGTNYGIFTYGSYSNNITNNMITTRGYSLNYGIYTDLGSSNNITNNIIYTNGRNNKESTCYGMYYSYSNLSVIANNTIITNGRGSGNYGILIEDVSSFGVEIVNNTIRTNGTNFNTGIYVDYSAGNFSIYNNTIEANGTHGLNDGISITDGHNITISENTIFSNGTNESHGIYFLANSDYNLISKNRITSTGVSSNAFYFLISGTDYPEYNNLTNNTLNDVDGFDLFLVSPSVNWTYLNDQPIRAYNFSGIGNVVYFRETGSGEIRFSELINGTGSNLSSDIRIGNNSVSVNSTNNNGLNRSANVTFFGVRTNYFNPVIVRDNKACLSNVCGNMSSLNAGTVEFNVTSFSNFSVESYPDVTIIAPTATTYSVNSTPVSFNIQENGYCEYSTDFGVSNTTLSENSSGTGFSGTRTLNNGIYVVSAYCNNTIGLMNNTVNISFSLNVPAPEPEETTGSPPSSGGGGDSGAGGDEGDIIEIILGCDPNWSCTDWGLCIDGFSVRECSDSNECNDDSNKPIDSQECECTPGFVCGDWGECEYVDTIEDIFTGEISLTGTKKRFCGDINKCSADYFETKECVSVVEVEIINVGDDGEEIIEIVEMPIELDFETSKDISGNDVIIAKSSKTGKPTAKIDVGALKEGRLEVSFVQDDDFYKKHCFNAVLDEDETGVDCGGSCEKCGEKNIRKYINNYYPFWSWLLLILIAISVFVERKYISRKK